MKRRTLKRQDLTRLLLGLIILVSLNVISSFVFSRIDLTSERRYTLSPATKDFLQKLDDVVYVKVYLEGEFPASFKKLRNATREMLDEFRAYSNNQIEYEFINPSENPDPKVTRGLYKQLYEKGLDPTTIQENEAGKASEKIVWPGALVSYRDKEEPLQLLKSQIGAAPEVMANNSIEGLEYELANTIRKLIMDKKPRVSFIYGHGELAHMQVADITAALTEMYDVDSVTIGGRIKSLDGYDAIIVAKPRTAFDEKDKFVIDQFIMKGGKVCWLLDAMDADMDSLTHSPVAMSFNMNLNLDDQLFRYGVRINPDLLQDLQSAPIPIVTGYVGNQPQQKYFPWFFFPLSFPNSNHPVVNNLNAVKFEFVSSLDTVGAHGVKKTILLQSSRYARLMYTPVRIGLNAVRSQPDPRQFNKPYRNLAVLLEGNFSSVFTNRIPPEIADSKEIGFKEKGKKTKMIVVADGDVIKNGYSPSSGAIYPLGYDRYTGTQYGNKNFMLNAIDYLCDASGLITLRSKEFKLRLLDKSKVDAEKNKWKLINVFFPVLLVFGFGGAKYYVRRKKFAS